MSKEIKPKRRDFLFTATYTIGAVGLGAADDKSKGIQMPETFISGDPDKGSTLVESCVACHGVDGNSISTDWPKLAGQNQKYLLEELKHFRDGERNNVLMMTVTPYLQTLSDQDLLDIAAFYSKYKTNVGTRKTWSRQQPIYIY